MMEKSKQQFVHREKTPWIESGFASGTLTKFTLEQAPEHARAAVK
ncbi:hypothetical protein [Paenibacillus plantiphilus]|nr:hypothetical protein [Paenibacillus plantiphilus]